MISQHSLKKRIEGLDELRGVAIFIVLFHHLDWLVGNYQLGGVAVDLFFIISGFLIGRILLQSKEKENYFRGFYGRRLFRIAPLALVTIVACFVLSKALGWNTDSLPYYFLFVQNYIPVQEVSGNHPDWSGPLAGAGPLWSLAVEEHFYLVVPFLIRFLSEKPLVLLCGGIALLSVYLKIDFISSNPSYQFYSNPTRTECRIVYLIAGLMLNFPFWKYRFLVAVAAFWAALHFGQGVSVGKLDLLGFLILFLVVDLTIQQKLRLRSKAVAWAGRLCFGIYLIHLPVSLALARSPLQDSPVIVIALYLLVVGIAAAISFRFFEEPIRKWGYQRLASKQKASTVRASSE